MPTYEYACRDCGEHLEVVQSFKDDPLTVCPACEGELRKVFSAAGIIFKGSGWHIKDYAASSSTSAPSDKSETTASDSTSTSDTTKSDATKSGSPKSDSSKSGSPKSDTSSESKSA